MPNIAFSPNNLIKHKHVLKRLDSNLHYLEILCKIFSAPDSCLVLFKTGERAFRTDWRRGYVGSSTCVEAAEKTEVSTPVRNQIRNLFPALAAILSQISKYSNEMPLWLHSNRTEKLSDHCTEGMHIIESS
jgi:hypothetical protein